MPNHVTTVCTITGSPADVERFLATHFGKTDEGADWFKFDTIVPKPACVDASESSSDADAGFYALTGLAHVQFAQFADTPMHLAAQGGKFKMGPLTTYNDFRAWLETENPAAIKAGEAMLRCFRETGHRSWYDWNIANWGTKWGAYDTEIRSIDGGTAVFKFETAWSFPKPVFEQLAKLYPECVFSVVSFDEGWNFACTGEFNGRNDFAEVKATPELYEQAYGKKHMTDDEDEEIN